MNFSDFSKGQKSKLNPSVFMNMEMEERALLTDDDIAGLDMTFYRALKKDSLTGMFNGCTGLKTPDLSRLNTTGVKRMDWMFAQCRNLRRLDLSGFDTSDVSSMPYMFDRCESLTELNLRGFDFSKATSLYQMFTGCSGLRRLIVSETILNAKVITRSTGRYKEEWTSTWSGAHSPSQADFAGTLERVCVEEKETIALGAATKAEQFSYLGLGYRVEIVVVPHKRR